MAQIAGQVDDSGQPINNGSTLFTVGRPSKGKYNVTYNTPFPTIPAVVATENSDGDSNADAIRVRDSDEEGFSVTIQSTGGNLQDRGFNFIATDVEDPPAAG